MPELNISKEMIGDDVCVVELSGFLDAHTFEQLDESIQEVFDEDICKVIADMSGVEYISSAGAGVFIGSLSVAQEGDGNIVLVNPTDNVQEVFDLLGLSQIFTIVATREEALNAF